jgi:hypothetical protein
VVGSPSIPHSEFEIVTKDNLKLKGWSFVPQSHIVASAGTVIFGAWKRHQSAAFSVSSS